MKNSLNQVEKSSVIKKYFIIKMREKKKNKILLTDCDHHK